MGDVGAVIVTYESGRVVGHLLRSLQEHEPGVTVVVADSASPSGPPDVGRAALVALADNRGYGAACNAGASHLLEEQPGATVLAFLNPDVRLAGPSLSELAAQLRDRPGVGIVAGPTVDGDGRRRPSAWGPPSAPRALWFAAGWKLPRLRRLVGRVLRRGAFTSGASTASADLEVDGFVVGGAFVVRKECWEQLGGFDEHFFMFGEDMDLCQRARAAGWEVRVLPCTPIVHSQGTSSAGVSEHQRWEWYVEGTRRYAHKHLAPRQATRIDRALRWGRRLRVRPRRGRA